MKEYLSKLRKDYSKMALNENEVDKNPIIQFEHWIADAANAEVNEPNAMVLSTVDKNNLPHSRIVLLRDIKNGCFSFYTNYHSSKGNDIELNPNVCLNFFWPDVERQVRIEGVASKMTLLDSTEYFRSRPRESRISAWASEQSSVIESRESLEKIWNDLEEKWKNTDDIEKPKDWGGYSVKPTVIEFWQGRPGRLHDRLRYRKQGDSWILERLAP